MLSEQTKQTMFTNILSFVAVPSAPATPKQTSEQKIRLQIEELEKRRAFQQRKADDQGVAAKAALAKKDQRAARMCMKRRLEYAKQVAAIDNSIANLDTMLTQLEAQSINAAVVKSMAAGAQAMKQAQRKLDAKKVDDVMIEVDETLTDAREINVAVSQPLASAEFDNDQLDDELAAYMAGETEAVAVETATTEPKTTPKFPATPQTKPKAEDDDELAALAAEMAM